MVRQKAFWSRLEGSRIHWAAVWIRASGSLGPGLRFLCCQRGREPMPPMVEAAQMSNSRREARVAVMPNSSMPVAVSPATARLTEPRRPAQRRPLFLASPRMRLLITGVPQTYFRCKGNQF